MIEIGQSYKKALPPWSVWEVLARASDLSGIRHLRIRNIKDPTITKLISESTIVVNSLAIMTP